MSVSLSLSNVVFVDGWFDTNSHFAFECHTDRTNQNRTMYGEYNIVIDENGMRHNVLFLQNENCVLKIWDVEVIKSFFTGLGGVDIFLTIDFSAICQNQQSDLYECFLPKNFEFQSINDAMFK